MSLLLLALFWSLLWRAPFAVDARVGLLHWTKEEWVVHLITDGPGLVFAALGFMRLYRAYASAREATRHG